MVALTENIKYGNLFSFILRKLDAAAVKLWTAIGVGPLQRQTNAFFSGNLFSDHSHISLKGGDITREEL